MENWRTVFCSLSIPATVVGTKTTTRIFHILLFFSGKISIVKVQFRMQLRSKVALVDAEKPRKILIVRVQPKMQLSSKVAPVDVEKPRAVDQNLGTDGFNADEACRLLLLSLVCSSPNPRDRPTMPHVLHIVSKMAPPLEVPQFKLTYVWPPEGGMHFELSDTEVTSGSYAGTGNGTSAHATQATSSCGSFQLPTAPNRTKDYFPVLSPGL
uniref:Putative lectin-like protein kinase n=1 Tax=Phyllostachys edulis TaxID=38705 RepID=D3IVD1_PHYED|nr:putative lectin-like protein kinase [Phyllostachys edulis]